MNRKKENRVDDITLNHLLSLSHEALSFAPGLSGYYMNLYRRLSFKNGDFQNNIIKEDICSTCCTPKLAGITTNVQIIRKEKNKNIISHNKQKSNDQLDSQVNKVSDIQERKEAMNNSNLSVFKPRTITIIDRYSRNIKKQRKRKIPEKKIVLPTTNLIKQQCKLCYTITLRSGGTSRIHKKIKDKESDKKLEVSKIGININKVEKNKENKAQNLGKIPKKGLKNILPEKSKKNVNKKLPAAKLMNLSKMLAKDKKPKDNNDKGNGFKLEDFLSGFK